VIPTLLYTWHNFEVISKATNPERNKAWFYSLLVFITTICVGVVVISLWYVWSWYSLTYPFIVDYTSANCCIAVVLICYCTAACLLGGTIWKARGLSRKRDQLLIQTGPLNKRLVVLHIALLLAQSCLISYNSIASMNAWRKYHFDFSTKPTWIYFFASIGQAILDIFLCLIFCHMVRSKESTRRIMVLHRKAVRKGERIRAKQVNNRSDKTRLDKLLNDEVSASERQLRYQMDDAASAAHLDLSDKEYVEFMKCAAIWFNEHRELLMVSDSYSDISTERTLSDGDDGYHYRPE
jgi:hypothetical protein